MSRMEIKELQAENAALRLQLNALTDGLSHAAISIRCLNQFMEYYTDTVFPLIIWGIQGIKLLSEKTQVSLPKGAEIYAHWLPNNPSSKKN